jgi:hypothetical protein
MKIVFVLDESIEPPKRVQAIAGPQSNTLLVSWEQPSSTIATARGYRVLVDGRHLQDITNPTSKFHPALIIELF